MERAHLRRGTDRIVSGATLTIEAGAEVYFARSAGITVEGHLEIAGTSDDRVLLSADGVRPTASWWDGISVQMMEGGTLAMDYTTVEFAGWAVATWEDGADPTLAGPDITVSVRHSELRYNHTGYTPDDNSELSQSSVWCNTLGVFIASEDDPVITHTGNNICHNIEDGVKAWQDAADMSGNYWCTDDLTAIGNMIYDERDDIDMGGIVTFEPILTSPAPGAPAFPY